MDHALLLTSWVCRAATARRPSAGGVSRRRPPGGAWAGIAALQAARMTCAFRRADPALRAGTLSGISGSTLPVPADYRRSPQVHQLRAQFRLRTLPTAETKCAASLPGSNWFRSSMDRMKDSGSFDWGSSPHGITEPKTQNNDLKLSLIHIFPINH